MKNLNLTIDEPCAENWNAFTHTSAGGFCSSCQTTVVDFTGMSDAEIYARFTAQPGAVCGRFKSTQLKTFTPLFSISPGLRLFVAGMMLLLFSVMSKPAVASIRPAPIGMHVNTPDAGTRIALIIRGIVRSEEGEVMPGVNVYLKESTVGTVTDASGKFEFPKELTPGDVIVFSFLGYEKVEYTVPENPVLPLEITLKFETSIILGKVAVDEVYGEKNNRLHKFLNKIGRIF